MYSVNTVLHRNSKIETRYRQGRPILQIQLDKKNINVFLNSSNENVQVMYTDLLSHYLCNYTSYESTSLHNLNQKVFMIFIKYYFVSKSRNVFKTNRRLALVKKLHFTNNS